MHVIVVIVVVVVASCKICHQEFMSSACIEHLDFLDLSTDVEHTFRTFQEKDKGKHYRSLTEIPKLVKMEMEEAWSKTNVSALSRVIAYLLDFRQH